MKDYQVEEQIDIANDLFFYGRQIEKVISEYGQIRSMIHENIREYKKYQHLIPDEIYYKYAVESQQMLNSYYDLIKVFDSKYEKIKKESNNLREYKRSLLELYHKMFMIWADCKMNAKSGNDIRFKFPAWFRVSVTGFMYNEKK